MNPVIVSTTILAVRKDGHVAIGGDGQVTMNAAVVKQDAKKIRRLYHDKVIVGFAGSSAKPTMTLWRGSMPSSNNTREMSCAAPMN